MRKLLVFIILGLIGMNVHAVHAADPFFVQSNTATSDFGKELRFELNASSDLKVTDVAFLYTFGVGTDELTAFTEAPTEWQQDGSTVRATFVRDTSIEYLPINVVVRYKWIATLDDGSTATTPEQSIQYNDTRFSWKEKTARGITIRWYEGGDAWGQEILDQAVAGLDRLEKQIGTTVSDPMTIAIYANTSDMRAALPPNSADWIGGQARPDLGLIIGAITEGNSNEVKRLVPHELSHLILHQATDNNYGGMPVWFDEGMAVVNQAIPDADFEDMVKNAARDDALIPLRALASNFPSDPDKALLSYAQSASVIRYIQSTYGDQAIAKLTSLFKAGTTDDQAIQTALGISLDDLDAQWRATLPKATRTAKPIAAPDKAPSERFRDKPVTVGGNSATTPSAPTQATAKIPLWVWVVGGLGLMLILAGIGWNMRESRQTTRY